MKATFAIALGAVVLMAAGAAQAQTSRKTHAAQTPSANRTIVSPYVQPNPPYPQAQPPALFKIGNLPVGLWAPVEPPYDARANRNNAANPLWYDPEAPM